MLQFKPQKILTSLFVHFDLRQLKFVMFIGEICLTLLTFKGQEKNDEFDYREGGGEGSLP